MDKRVDFLKAKKEKSECMKGGYLETGVNGSNAEVVMVWIRITKKKTQCYDCEGPQRNERNAGIPSIKGEDEIEKIQCFIERWQNLRFG